MAWRQVDPMTERLHCIRDARQRVVTFTDRCQLSGLSRTTGYQGLHRAEPSGLDYLQELSRRPHCCAPATPPGGGGAAPRSATAPSERGSPGAPPAAPPPGPPSGRGALLARAESGGRAPPAHWAYDAPAPPTLPWPSRPAAHADDRTPWDLDGGLDFLDPRYHQQLLPMS